MENLTEYYVIHMSGGSHILLHYNDVKKLLEAISVGDDNLYVYQSEDSDELDSFIRIDNIDAIELAEEYYSTMQLLNPYHLQMAGMTPKNNEKNTSTKTNT